MNRPPLWLMLAAIAICDSVRADSDGYMCVGPDYLILESRSFDHDGKHRLVFYPLRDGIGPKTEVLLPDFQTHGLECSASVVRVHGWMETHEVDVSQLDRPRYRGAVESPRAGSMDAHAPLRHVSGWPSGRLYSDKPSDQPFYELKVSNLVTRYPGVLETTTVAKVLRFTPDGGFLESRVIYAGTSAETID